MAQVLSELMEIAGMGPEDIELLRRFEPVVRSHLDELVKCISHRFTTAPHVSAVYADPERRQWMEGALGEFISRLVGGDYDEAMGEWLLRLGSEVIRIGRGGSHIALTVGITRDGLIDLVQSEHARDSDMALRMTEALRKAFDVCLAMLWRAYERTREDVIDAQRQAMLELATPVVEIWQGVLVMPLIGTIDTRRAKQITEVLLDRIIAHEAAIVLVDITGVPIVDTEVANHIIRTIQAARLLGANCLLVGIRPEIAQTLVHLGIDLGGITTVASLYMGLQAAFRMQGIVCSRRDGG